MPVVPETDESRTELEPSQDHYILRVFPNEKCPVCYGGKPVHKVYRGNDLRLTICPLATVEILEFRKGKK